MPSILLDSEVLLALAWQHHPLHAAVRRWFLEQEARGWHTSAETQLAFLKASSNPLVVRARMSLEEAASVLRVLTRRPAHRFLATVPAPEEASCRAFWEACGAGFSMPRAYLLALAEHHGCVVATLDKNLAGLSAADGLVEKVTVG